MKNTKRFMALLLTLVLVFGSMSSAFAAVNEDVMDTDFEVAVTKLNAVGIMEGYPDGTFRPEGQITRAEFAKIAVLALGLNDAAEVSKSNTIFSDVDAFHWAAGYINVAVDRGILKGYPDGTYRPSNPLSNAEAITVLTRLIGLGPVVDKEGNWPANYITRANIEGVLDDVIVSSTSNASRGNAAKMLVNTLTINKWGAVGYDNDGSVSYGQTNDTLLNDNLAINQFKEVVATGKDKDDNEVTFSKGSWADTFEVTTDVNVYELYLNESTIWVNSDDEIIFADITSDFYLDAAEFDGKELKLKTADKTLDIDNDVVVYVDETDNSYIDSSNNVVGSADGNTYPLAKVVLNSKNDVIYVDAYTLDDVVVAVEAEDNVVTTIDGDEIDMKDWIIFKDGKYISVEDIAEDDVVFFNNSTEYAEVYVNSVAGEIENVYEESFVVDDEDYKYDDSMFLSWYLDEDEDFVRFNEDAADQMQDEEDTVSVFFDRAGDVVYVVGTLGESTTNNVAGLLLTDAKFDVSFERSYGEFTFVNESGQKVTETVKFTDLDKVNGIDVDVVAPENTTPTTPISHVDVTDDKGTASTADDVTIRFDGTSAGKGAVLEFVYDEDGDVVEINMDEDGVGSSLTTNAYEVSNFNDATNPIETSDNYIGTSRIKSGTVVFLIDGLTSGALPSGDIDDDDVSVVAWNDAEDFNEISIANYYVDDAEVNYIVALDSDKDTDTTDVKVLYDDHRTKYDSTDISKLTAWSTDGKTTYTVDSGSVSDLNLTNTTGGAVHVIKVDDETGEIKGITYIGSDSTKVVTGLTIASATDVNVSDNTIKVGSTTYKLVSDSIILDAADGSPAEISLRDLKHAGYTINIVLDADNSVYAEMVIVTSKP